MSHPPDGPDSVLNEGILISRKEREFVELLLVIFLLTILEQKTFTGLSWR